MNLRSDPLESLTGVGDRKTGRESGLRTSGRDVNDKGPVTGFSEDAKLKGLVMLFLWERSSRTYRSLYDSLGACSRVN